MRFSIKTIPITGVSDIVDFMPYFKEIVSLGWQIVEHPDVRPNGRLFTFDLQVIIPLYAVGWRCPHAETRREAIALFLTPR